MQRFKIIMVDDFFQDPMQVRNIALNESFDYPKKNFPGHRSRLLQEINHTLFEDISHRISSLAFAGAKLNIISLFQWTPSFYQKGWAHKDIDVSHAGVVYLNPLPPPNSGTCFLTPNFEGDLNLDEYDARDNFYSGSSVDSDLCALARENHNSKFSITSNVENKFNRFILFDAEMYHKEELFFGESQSDSRLTLLFFIHQLDN